MPQTITNIPRCLPQILTVPEFWCHLAHSFSHKNVPFDFERAFWEAEGALSKPKGPFLRENECAAKWYQNSGTVKICGRQREYLWSSVAFVEAWIKSNFPNGTTSLKTMQMLHKNKACYKYIFNSLSAFWIKHFKTFEAVFLNISGIIARSKVVPW